MPTSEARIRANQANGALSKGPVTERGKSISRANSLKHGLTGAGVVIPEGDAAEVERMEAEFRQDFRPETGAGHVLVRRMALLAVRMERCATQETAAIGDRVRRAEADFVPPDGVDDETADHLRAEAGRRALFDPSKEACLARKYEAAAERGFFRAMKELRIVEKRDKAIQSRPVAEQLGSSLSQTVKALGSFLPEAVEPPPAPRRKAETPVAVPKPVHTTPILGPKPTKNSLLAWDPVPLNGFELSFAAGRAR